MKNYKFDVMIFAVVLLASFCDTGRAAVTSEATKTTYEKNVPGVSVQQTKDAQTHQENVVQNLQEVARIVLNDPIPAPSESPRSTIPTEPKVKPIFVVNPEPAVLIDPLPAPFGEPKKAVSDDPYPIPHVVVPIELDPFLPVSANPKIIVSSDPYPAPQESSQPIIQIDPFLPPGNTPGIFPVLNYYYSTGTERVSLYANGDSLTVSTTPMMMTNVWPSILRSETYTLNAKSGSITHSVCVSLCQSNDINPSDGSAYLDALKAIKSKIDGALSSNSGIFRAGTINTTMMADPGSSPAPVASIQPGTIVKFPLYPKLQLERASKILEVLIIKHSHPVIPSSVSVPSDSTHPYTDVFTDSSNKISVQRANQMTTNSGISSLPYKTSYTLDKTTGVITIGSGPGLLVDPTSSGPKTGGAMIARLQRVVKPGEPTYQMVLKSMLSMFQVDSLRVKTAADRIGLESMMSELRKWLSSVVPHPFL